MATDSTTVDPEPTNLSLDRQESPKEQPTNLSKKYEIVREDYEMVEKDKDDSRCDLPTEVYLRESRLFARGTILRGKRYGPFVGQLLPKPINERYAVEVSLLFWSGI